MARLELLLRNPTTGAKTALFTTWQRLECRGCLRSSPLKRRVLDGE